MGFFLAFRLHRLGSFGSKLYKLVDSSVVVLRFSRTMRYCQLLFLALTAGVFLAMPIIDGSAPYEDSFSRVRLHQLALVLPYAAILPAATVFSRVFRKRGHLGVGLSLQGVYHWSWFG